MLDIKNLEIKYDRTIFTKLNINNISTGMNFIIGRSGCGKTSFINAIIGLNKYSKGEIYLNNKLIKNYTEFREKYVSIVFQEDNLIPYYTIKENLMMVNNSINEIKQYLIKFKLINKLNSYPSTLSGGERQRINIIRAFLKHSYINIFDEPTSSVNESLKDEIMKIIKELFENKIVIIISHNQYLVNKYADRIIDLENNKDVIINKKEQNKIKECKYNPPLFKLNLSSYKKRNLLPLVVISLVYIIVFSTLSLFSGINRYIEYSLSKKIDYNYFYIINENNDEEINEIRNQLTTNLNIKEINDYKSILSNDYFKEIKFNNNYLNEYYEIHVYTGEDKIIINKQLFELIKSDEISFIDKIYKAKIIDDGKLYTTPNIYFEYNFLYSILGDIKSNNIAFITENYEETYNYLKDNFDNYFSMNNDNKFKFDNSTILINESLKPLLSSIHSLVLLLSYSVIVMAISFIKTLIDYNLKLREKEINIYYYFGLKNINLITIIETIILTFLPLLISTISFIYLTPILNKLSILLLDEYFPILRFNFNLLFYVILIVILINIIIIYGNRFNKHKKKL